MRDLLDVLDVPMTWPAAPVAATAAAAATAESDGEVARLLHWFFDGAVPPELHPAGLIPWEAGALLRRSGGGYDPGIMKTTGSCSSG